MRAPLLWLWPAEFPRSDSGAKGSPRDRVMPQDFRCITKALPVNCLPHRGQPGSWLSEELGRLVVLTACSGTCGACGLLGTLPPRRGGGPGGGASLKSADAARGAILRGRVRSKCVVRSSNGGAASRISSLKGCATSEFHSAFGRGRGTDGRARRGSSASPFHFIRRKAGRSSPSWLKGAPSLEFHSATGRRGRLGFVLGFGSDPLSKA